MLQNLVILQARGSGQTASPASRARSRYVETDVTEILVSNFVKPAPTSQNYLDVELARAGKHRKIAFSVPSYAALGHVLEATSADLSPS